MAHVYIVTHGDKGSEPNPGMTDQGFVQIRSLAPHLPAFPSTIICGTGKRHLDMAHALDWTPTRWSEVVGGPSSLEKVEGVQVIVLADGTRVPREAYTTMTDLASAMKDLVMNLPDSAVIFAGRPAMIQLGMKEAKNGAVYRITLHYPHRYQTTGVIASIDEIAVAGGDIGAGAKEV